MSEDADPPTGIPHFEDPNAPLIYVDGCLGGGPMHGDNLTLTFAAKFLDHTRNPPASHSKTMVRLVMPRSSAARMVEFVAKMLGDAEGGSVGPTTGATLN
jgi:hypothetical protein